MNISETSLDDQIKFMEEVNKYLTTPLTIAIINSLKELRGIKQNQIESFKKLIQV